MAEWDWFDDYLDSWQKEEERRRKEREKQNQDMFSSMQEEMAAKMRGDQPEATRRRSMFDSPITNPILSDEEKKAALRRRAEKAGLTRKTEESGQRTVDIHPDLFTRDFGGKALPTYDVTDEALDEYAEPKGPLGKVGRIAQTSVVNQLLGVTDFGARMLPGGKKFYNYAANQMWGQDLDSLRDDLREHRGDVTGVYGARKDIIDKWKEGDRTGALSGAGWTALQGVVDILPSIYPARLLGGAATKLVGGADEVAKAAATISKLGGGTKLLFGTKALSNADELLRLARLAKTAYTPSVAAYVASTGTMVLPEVLDLYDDARDAGLNKGEALGRAAAFAGTSMALNAGGLALSGAGQLMTRAAGKVGFRSAARTLADDANRFAKGFSYLKKSRLVKIGSGGFGEGVTEALEQLAEYNIRAPWDDSLQDQSLSAQMVDAGIAGALTGFVFGAAHGIGSRPNTGWQNPARQQLARLRTQMMIQEERRSKALEEYTNTAPFQETASGQVVLPDVEEYDVLAGMAGGEAEYANTVLENNAPSRVHNDPFFVTKNATDTQALVERAAALRDQIEIGSISPTEGRVLLTDTINEAMTAIRDQVDIQLVDSVITNIEQGTPLLPTGNKALDDFTDILKEVHTESRVRPNFTFLQMARRGKGFHFATAEEGSTPEAVRQALLERGEDPENYVIRATKGGSIPSEQAQGNLFEGATDSPDPVQVGRRFSAIPKPGYTPPSSLPDAPVAGQSTRVVATSDPVRVRTNQEIMREAQIRYDRMIRQQGAVAMASLAEKVASPSVHEAADQMALDVQLNIAEDQNEIWEQLGEPIDRVYDRSDGSLRPSRQEIDIHADKNLMITARQLFDQMLGEGKWDSSPAARMLIDQGVEEHSPVANTVGRDLVRRELAKRRVTRDSLAKFIQNPIENGPVLTMELNSSIDSHALDAVFEKLLNVVRKVPGYEKIATLGERALDRSATYLFDEKYEIQGRVATLVDHLATALNEVYGDGKPITVGKVTMGRGPYDGKFSRNFRVPLENIPPQLQKPFAALLGGIFGQEAQAATTFTAYGHVPGDVGNSYTILDSSNREENDPIYNTLIDALNQAGYDLVNFEEITISRDNKNRRARLIHVASVQYDEATDTSFLKGISIEEMNAIMGQVLSQDNVSAINPGMIGYQLAMQEAQAALQADMDAAQGDPAKMKAAKMKYEKAAHDARALQSDPKLALEKYKKEIAEELSPTLVGKKADDFSLIPVHARAEFYLMGSTVGNFGNEARLPAPPAPPQTGIGTRVHEVGGVVAGSVTPGELDGKEKLAIDLVNNGNDFPDIIDVVGIAQQLVSESPILGDLPPDMMVAFRTAAPNEIMNIGSPFHVWQATSSLQSIASLEQYAAYKHDFYVRLLTTAAEMPDDLRNDADQAVAEATGQDMRLWLMTPNGGAIAFSRKAAPGDIRADRMGFVNMDMGSATDAAFLLDFIENVAGIPRSLVEELRTRHRDLRSQYDKLMDDRNQHGYSTPEFEKADEALTAFINQWGIPRINSLAQLYSDRLVKLDSSRLVEWSKAQIKLAEEAWRLNFQVQPRIKALLDAHYQSLGFDDEKDFATHLEKAQARLEKWGAPPNYITQRGLENPTVMYHASGTNDVVGNFEGFSMTDRAGVVYFTPETHKGSYITYGGAKWDPDRKIWTHPNMVEYYLSPEGMENVAVYGKGEFSRDRSEDTRSRMSDREWADDLRKRGIQAAVGVRDDGSIFEVVVLDHKIMSRAAGAHAGAFYRAIYNPSVFDTNRFRRLSGDPTADPEPAVVDDPQARGLDLSAAKGPWTTRAESNEGAAVTGPVNDRLQEVIHKIIAAANSRSLESAMVLPRLIKAARTIDPQYNPEQALGMETLVQIYHSVALGSSPRGAINAFLSKNVNGIDPEFMYVSNIAVRVYNKELEPFDYMVRRNWDKGTAYLSNSSVTQAVERSMDRVEELDAKYRGKVLDSQDAWEIMSMEAMNGSAVGPAPAWAIDMKAKGSPEAAKFWQNADDKKFEAGLRGVDVLLKSQEMYNSGRMSVKSTLRRMMWNTISSSIGTFVHESAYMRMQSAETLVDVPGFRAVLTFDEILDVMLDESYSEITKRRIWAKWVDKNFPAFAGKGKTSPFPWNGATKNVGNLGANRESGKKTVTEAGNTLISVMTRRFEDGPYQGKRLLDAAHEMLSDPNVSGQQFRSFMLRYSGGSGMMNKLLSFVALTAGKTDVMVPDRILTGLLWGQSKGWYEGFHSRLFQGPMGEVYTRVFENELMPMMHEALVQEFIRRGYPPEAVDRIRRAGVGAVHWIAWQVAGDQVASHPTFENILMEEMGITDPWRGAYVMQGDADRREAGTYFFPNYRGRGPMQVVPLHAGGYAVVPYKKFWPASRKLKLPADANIMDGSGVFLKDREYMKEQWDEAFRPEAVEIIDEVEFIEARDERRRPGSALAAIVRDVVQSTDGSDLRAIAESEIPGSTGISRDLATDERTVSGTDKLTDALIRGGKAEAKWVKVKLPHEVKRNWVAEMTPEELESMGAYRNDRGVWVVDADAWVPQLTTFKDFEAAMRDLGMSKVQASVLGGLMRGAAKLSKIPEEEFFTRVLRYLQITPRNTLSAVEDTTRGFISTVDRSGGFPNQGIGAVLAGESELIFSLMLNVNNGVDFSTALHETGHFIRHLLPHDMQVSIYKAMGVNEADAHDYVNMGFAPPQEIEELWAHMFEQYFYGGKSNLPPHLRDMVKEISEFYRATHENILLIDEGRHGTLEINRELMSMVELVLASGDEATHDGVAVSQIERAYERAKRAYERMKKNPSVGLQRMDLEHKDRVSSLINWRKKANAYAHRHGVEASGGGNWAHWARTGHLQAALAHLAVMLRIGSQHHPDMGRKLMAMRTLSSSLRAVQVLFPNLDHATHEPLLGQFDMRDEGHSLLIGYAQQSSTRVSGPNPGKTTYPASIFKKMESLRGASDPEQVVRGIEDAGVKLSYLDLKVPPPSDREQGLFVLGDDTVVSITRDSLVVTPSFDEALIHQVETDEQLRDAIEEARQKGEEGRYPVSYLIQRPEHKTVFQKLSEGYDPNVPPLENANTLVRNANRSGWGWLKDTLSSFYRAMVDSQAALEKVAQQRGWTGLTQLMTMARSANESAYYVINRGTKLWDDSLNGFRRTGEGLAHILGGRNKRFVEDLEALAIAHREIGIYEEVSQVPSKLAAAMVTWKEVDDQLALKIEAAKQQEDRAEVARLIARRKDHRKAAPRGPQMSQFYAKYSKDKAGFELRYQQAKQTIAKIKAENPGSYFAELNDSMWRLTYWAERAILDRQLEIGAISKAEYDLIKLRRNERGGVYVPFHRIWEHATSPDSRQITGDLGDGVLPPVSALILKAQRVSRWADYQLVNNELYRIAKQDMALPPDQRALPEVRIYESGNVVPPPILQKYKKVTAYENGTAYHMYLPEDIYQAVGGGEWGGAQLKVLKAASAMTHIKRMGATLAPAFIFRNLLRDQLTAGMNSRWGYRPFVGIINTALAAFGVPGWANEETMQYMDEFYRNNAAIAGMVETGYQHSVKTLEDVLASRKDSGGKLEPESLSAKIRAIKSRYNPLNPMGVAVAGKTFLEHAAGKLEQATRMSLYINARKRGADAMQATEEAREGTIDFKRAGSVGRKVNAYYAFFNAQMQDPAKALRMMRSQEKTGKELLGVGGRAGYLLRGALFMTIPSMVNLFLNWDDEDYEKLPEWDRALFFHQKIGSGKNSWYMRFPRPLGIAHLVFGYGFEKLMRGLAHKDPEAFSDFIHAFSEGTPLQYITPDRGLVHNLTPDAIKPIVELGSNYDSFRDKVITPRSEEVFAKEMRGDDYFGAMEVGLSRASRYLNPMKEFEEGLLSPYEVNHLVSGYFATLGRYGLDTINNSLDLVAQYAFDKPGASKRRLPEELTTGQSVARTVGLASRNPIGIGGKPLNDFYEILKRGEKGSRSAKEMINSGQSEAAWKYMRRFPEAAFYKDASSLAREFSEMRKLRRKIIMDETMSVEEKRDQVINLDMLMGQKAALFVELVHDLSPEVKLRAAQ